MSILSWVPVFFPLALIAPAVLTLGRVYRQSRAPREMSCPADGHLTTIQIDARHAVAMHALGESRRRVQTCSMWPERRACGQECVRAL